MAQIHALTPEGRLPSTAVAHVQEIAPGPYDSGLLNINNLATTRTAGDIYLRRSGPLVFLQVTGLLCSDQAHGFTAFTLPPEYRPGLNIIDMTPIHIPLLAETGGNRRRTIIGADGRVRFFEPDPATAIYYSATWMTSAAPPA